MANTNGVNNGVNTNRVDSDGAVHQRMEDNESRDLTTTDARQGVASGRVLTVLLVSTVLLAVIFAVIWLTAV